MDPNENIKRQRELAAQIAEVAASAGETWEETDSEDTEVAANLGVELAELVLALDGWRLKGGFDPYASVANYTTEPHPTGGVVVRFKHDA